MSSLVERDFILRLVKQLVELVARALKLARGQKKDEAVEVLEAGCVTLLGIDFRALTLVDTASAVDLLGTVPRMVAFAKLLVGLSDVYAACGDEPLATARARHAAEVALEVLERVRDQPDALEVLKTVAPRVGPPAPVGR